MATGPEHYREAERLLATAYDDTVTTYDSHNPEADRVIAEAQAHATLALVAATAMQMGSAEYREWYQAAGVKSAPRGGDRDA